MYSDIIKKFVSSSKWQKIVGIYIQCPVGLSMLVVGLCTLSFRCADSGTTVHSPRRPTPLGRQRDSCHNWSRINSGKGRSVHGTSVDSRDGCTVDGGKGCRVHGRTRVHWSR